MFTVAYRDRLRDRVFEIANADQRVTARAVDGLLREAGEVQALADRVASQLHMLTADWDQ